MPPAKSCGIPFPLEEGFAKIPAMLLDGSPQWQHSIFLVAGVLFALCVWRGWRLGVVRGLLGLAALFCAWIGGSAAAGTTGTVLAYFSKVPPLLEPAVAGLSVGLAIYITIGLLAGLLFKKTGDHSGVTRMAFGIGGALCGAVYGLLLLWAGITLIRGLGALGELRVVQARNEGTPIQDSRTALFLIRLKESLELGVTGNSLRKADPLPTAFYDDIVKISMVAGNQHAIERLVQYPGTLKILSNRHIAGLLQDPALEEASRSRNILPLLSNPHVTEAARDPELLAELRNFDLGAALDYALQEETKASPSPTPVSPHSLRGAAPVKKVPARHPSPTQP
jgi:hypothetical protein